MMQPSIFISYEHQCRDFVQILCMQLEAMGYATWWDRDIPPGQEWRKEIDDAIRAAFAMIVVMTPEARHSEYVTYEWSFALGMGKPVIPVLHKHTPFHPRFEVHQFLNFTDTVLRPWAELQERLRSIEQDVAAKENTDDDNQTPQYSSKDGPSLVEVLAELYYSGLIDLRTLNTFLTRKIITLADFAAIRQAAENRPNHHRVIFRG